MQKSQLLRMARILNAKRKEDENKSFWRAKYLDSNKLNIKVTKEDNPLDKIFSLEFSFKKLNFKCIF